MIRVLCVIGTDGVDPHSSPYLTHGLLYGVELRVSCPSSEDAYLIQGGTFVKPDNAVLKPTRFRA